MAGASCSTGPNYVAYLTQQFTSPQKTFQNPVQELNAAKPVAESFQSTNELATSGSLGRALNITV